MDQFFVSVVLAMLLVGCGAKEEAWEIKVSQKQSWAGAWWQIAGMVTTSLNGGSSLGAPSNDRGAGFDFTNG